jgi:hypothetical protein
MNPGIISAASNIRGGGDEPVTMEEVLEVYPQFSTEALPSAFLETILEAANAAIQSARWHTKRKLAICLYVAHFSTLYLKTLVDPTASPTSIARKGDGNGNVSSKSVGGVSVSYGSAEGASDLTGYGSWKDTVYGQQLASMARLVGAGMMVVR